MADFHEDWFAKMKGYPLLVAENSENKILAYGALQPQGNDEGSANKQYYDCFIDSISPDPVAFSIQTFSSSQAHHIGKQTTAAR